MIVERRGHTATRLADGRVLIAGGENSSGSLNQAEIYDAAAATFSTTGNMGAARADHTATLLSDGRVLLAGGHDSTGALATTEIFDPTTGTFTSGPTLSVARAGHTATLFADGRILFAGGDANGSAEILSANLSSSSAVGAMGTPRSAHSAALMQDGRVLIVGGRDANGDLSSGEIFDNGSFSNVDGSLHVARVRAHLRVLFDGKVQIIGGSNDGSMEIYDPSIATFGAYAHVAPEGDTCVGLPQQVQSSQTRAALFYNLQSDATFDRSRHTMSELGSSAIVIGGSNTAGTILNSSPTFTSSSAQISTDKIDYQPGETAHISGRGFQPGETVRLKIHEDPHTPQERGLDAVADTDGNFSGDYLVAAYDLNMKFFVGARGLTSGRTSQTTFTDASKFTIAPLTQSVSAGSVNNFSWTFTAANGSSGGPVTLTVPSGGWTTPTTAAGPGQVTVTAGSCAASLASVHRQRNYHKSTSIGNGCGNNTTFTVNYNNVTAPSPASPPQTYTFDSNLVDTDAQVTVTGAANTDVSITKIANVSPISAGDTASFTITASNANSGITATNVVVTDTLPSGVTWTLSAPVAGCSISGGNSLTCNFGSIASNSNKSVTVVGTTSATNCGTLNNAAASLTADNDSTLGNNSASASIVVRCPDISVSKTADAGTVNAGEQIGYTITVTNSNAAGTGTA
jgi:uncharacterized repeat protein (TIGR01451 family)